MALTIASLNVRGLQDNSKRREVFNWLCQKHFSIYMLQEVHCTENTNDRWTAEWGYQSIFSTFKSNKSGVSILFNNNFNLQIQRVYIDPSGRFIIWDIKADDTCLTLTNIYAPNEDSPAFPEMASAGLEIPTFFNHTYFCTSTSLEIWNTVTK